MISFKLIFFTNVCSVGRGISFVSYLHSQLVQEYSLLILNLKSSNHVRQQIHRYLGKVFSTVSFGRDSQKSHFTVNSSNHNTHHVFSSSGWILVAFRCPWNKNILDTVTPSVHMQWGTEGTQVPRLRFDHPVLLCFILGPLFRHREVGNHGPWRPRLCPEPGHRIWLSERFSEGMWVVDSTSVRASCVSGHC